MLSEENLNIIKGIISEGPSPDDSIKAVIKFIKSTFKEFAEINKSATPMNEKGLNQKLCIFLNRKIVSEPFFFQHEFIENVNSGNSRQVDIGTITKDERMGAYENAHAEEDSFFSIEAKRLSTEKKEGGKEYVNGNESGAMERFKKGLHASRLKYAAIIGYVQEETFDHWFLKINSWITELSNNDEEELWSDDDRLTRVANNTDTHLCELLSKNSRTINGLAAEKIKLFHFWVNLIN